MRKNQKEMKNRTLEEARYIIDNHATVRQTAKNFGVSKSTVHMDVTERLLDYSSILFEGVKIVLSENKAERALRGGLATKKKYLLLRKSGLI